MDIKYALIGVARGAGLAALTAFLAYLGNADHLTALSPDVAMLISFVALGVEHAIESGTGRALFGLVKA